MTKLYVLISAALLVAMLFGSMIFEGGAKLVDVSWNSLPTLNWTAAPGQFTG